ncbi:MAG: hypothetical protein ACJ71Z_00435 [Aeromicrobium sp.]
MARRVGATIAVAPLLAAVLLAGCAPQAKVPVPERTTATPTPADLSADESGPESPIAYGFRVPRGASQVGPLVRYRSARLIHAYQPELDAAQARRDADRQRRRDEAEARGTPLPPPTPTPTAAPTSDTFRLLTDPPKPDVTVSLMRINGEPTTVVRAMLAQIDVILPKAGIVRSDISRYCASTERRITSCRLRARGSTKNGRKLAVTLAVDPGNLASRTSPPASNQKPVMYLRVAYIGDPRDGQANRRHDSDVDVPAGVLKRDTSGLIWPGMDLDARMSSRILNGWRAPLGSKILLSAYHPAFAVVSTEKALDASSIAEKFATGVQDEPTVDVVEDLNEVTTTYTAVGPNGDRALASYVLSARGYYAVLFWLPAPTPGTAQPTAPSAAATN